MRQGDDIAKSVRGDNGVAMVIARRRILQRLPDSTGPVGLTHQGVNGSRRFGFGLARVRNIEVAKQGGRLKIRPDRTHGEQRTDPCELDHPIKRFAVLAVIGEAIELGGVHELKP